MGRLESRSQDFLPTSIHNHLSVEFLETVKIDGLKQVIFSSKKAL